MTNLDFVGWVGQGRIADRTAERLALSDRGVLMLRKQLAADIEAAKRGEDPKGVVRDPEVNASIALPIADRAFLVDGAPLEQYRRHPVFGKHLDQFIFQAGQPPEVWAAYREAMGLG